MVGGRLIVIMLVDGRCLVSVLSTLQGSPQSEQRKHDSKSEMSNLGEDSSSEHGHEF